MIVVRNSTLRELCGYVGRPLAALFALDLLIAAAYVLAGWNWLALPAVPLSIIGSVIGVLVGFRNTSAYARWWEARTSWGGIVNHSRSLARQVLCMLPAAEAGRAAECEFCEVKRKVVLLQIAYVYALRNHLRGLDPWHELPRLIPEPDVDRLKGRANLPLAIQQTINAALTRCHRLGWIHSMVGLDRTLGQLMDCQGASERIKNTPMPRMYDMAIRVFIALYCLLLPLGMVESLRLLTPFGSTLVGFVFMALDQIGRDLEEPFENLPNDIPLNAIVRGIEIDLKQMMGEPRVPEPVAPADGILW